MFRPSAHLMLARATAGGALAATPRLCSLANSWDEAGNTQRWKNARQRAHEDLFGQVPPMSKEAEEMKRQQLSEHQGPTVKSYTGEDARKVWMEVLQESRGVIVGTVVLLAVMFYYYKTTMAENRLILQAKDRKVETERNENVKKKKKLLGDMAEYKAIPQPKDFALRRKSASSADDSSREEPWMLDKSTSERKY